MLIDRSVFGMYLTAAYIRGPKGVSLEVLQSPEFPENPRGSVTVHQRTDTDSIDAWLLPLIRTEVMWSSRNDIKTVQIEELAGTEDVYGNTRAEITNRYVHAQWSTERQCFIHFDGAVKIYTPGDYQRRLGTDMKKRADLKADYVKLYRLDGAIPLNVWCDLTSRFFYMNELVTEYLGGPDSTEG